MEFEITRLRSKEIEKQEAFLQPKQEPRARRVQPIRRCTASFCFRLPSVRKRALFVALSKQRLPMWEHLQPSVQCTSIQARHSAEESSKSMLEKGKLLCGSRSVLAAGNNYEKKNGNAVASLRSTVGKGARRRSSKHVCQAPDRSRSTKRTQHEINASTLPNRTTTLCADSSR